MKTMHGLFYALVFAVTCLQPVFADGGRDKTQPLPFKLSAEKLAGKGLGEFAPWPDDMILKGKSEHTFSELFNGEIVFGVYQSKPLMLNITNPWPFDELVMVLEGELRLVATGQSEALVVPAGSMALVPRGFTGTWEMAGEAYREFFVVEQNAYIKSQEPGALLSN